MKFSVVKITLSGLCLLIFSAFASAQSRHSVKATTDTDGTILTVTASRTDKKTDPIKPEILPLRKRNRTENQKFQLRPVARTDSIAD